MKVLRIQTAVIVFCLSGITNLHSQERSSVLLQNDILVMRTEGIAFLGSGMSEHDAKTFAINDAKRNALEQAGTYLESHTTVLNHQLVKEKVITFSASLVQVKVLHEVRKLVNSMFAVCVNIEAMIDVKLLNERIEEIRKDSNFRQQLEAERKKNKQLEEKIVQLQSRKGVNIKEEVKEVINGLTVVEWISMAFNTNDNNLRIKYYFKAIELDPRDTDAYTNRGIAYHGLGKYEEAIRDFDKAIELNPKNARAYSNRGYTYYYLGNYDAAIQDFNIAIELDPQNSVILLNRGATNGTIGNYEAAIRDLNKSIMLDPQDAGTYSNRGTTYAHLGKHEVAIRDFNKAIELDPQNASFYFNRGNTYFDLGNYNAAIRNYNKAIELDPQKVGAYIRRGSAYFELGNNEVAIKDFNKVIGLNPRSGNTYLRRGDAYLNVGNISAATNDYNRYLKIIGNKDGIADQVRQRIRSLGFTPQY